uniref:Uncharacterized protein n=1 Tax=Rhizophora mucronata TaxID=61149 RepID=A0A2P2PRD4_RHIMU
MALSIIQFRRKFYILIQKIVSMPQQLARSSVPVKFN